MIDRNSRTELRSRLFYKSTCPPCSWMSKLVVLFSLGSIKRIPLNTHQAKIIYRQHTEYEGQLMLQNGKRITFGRSVFAMVPWCIVTTWWRLLTSYILPLKINQKKHFMTQIEQADQHIFKKQSINNQFSKNGYVLLDIPDSNLTNQLTDIFKDVATLYHKGFSTTMLFSDAHHRIEIHQKVSKLLIEIVDHYLFSYRQICAGFAVKNANDVHSSMPLHQDITMSAPGGRPGLSFWMPLVPTNEQNGNLQVVPGSHLLYRTPRAPGTPFPFHEEEEEIRRKYLKSIPTTLGQVIIIDQSLFHASPPNMTEQIRPVATSILIPAESRLHYYYRETTTRPIKLKGYAVEDNFFFHQTLGAPAHSGTPTEVILENAQASRNVTFTN